MKFLVGAAITFFLSYLIIGYYEDKSKREISEMYRKHDVEMKKSIDDMDKMDREIKEIEKMYKKN